VAFVTNGSGMWGAAVPEDEVQLRLLSAALHSAANAIAIMNRGGVIEWVNPAFTAMTGYSEAEAVGRTARQLLRSGKQAAAFYDDLWHTVLRGHVWKGRLINRRKDGTLYPEEQVITPVRDAAGRVSHFIAVKEDVTERRRTEDRLRFQAQLLDAVGEAVIAADMKGRIRYWNRRAESLTGWRSDEVLGRSLIEVIVPKASRAEAQAVLVRVRAGESWSGEFDLLRRDGTTFPASVTDAPIRNEGGEVIGVVGVSRDLTAQRALEQQLRHAQKMEAVGRLAGGIAHDFNNVLTAIQGHVQFLIEELPEGDLLEDARVVRRSAQRASDLTQQLLAFSRRQVLKPEILDLGTVVREMERVLRPVVGEGIALSIKAPEEGGRVEADPGQIEQLLMNLVVNARDAMPEGGTLGITVSRADHGDFEHLVPGPVQPGPYLLLEVEDDGTGMDPFTLDRLFEPFFTTKAAGQGTGLGLGTVYGIVKQSGGHLLVESTPAEGTTFRIYLPRVDAPASGDPATPDGSAGPGRGEVVLVVEDEDAVRDLIRRVLERAGYEVIEASTPGQAVEAVERLQGRELRLILTDVVMPEMSGVELAAKLVAMRPGTPVVYMSGYAESEAARRGMTDARHRFVGKPFTPVELTRVVAEVLLGPR
jgi:two-component system, cell cycle sensor histidine kinase and response regulator CckA